VYSRSQRAISAIPTQILSQNFSDLNESGTNFNMASWENQIENGCVEFREQIAKNW